MQNGFVNPVLQLYQTKWTSDLLDENLLANALVTRPHEVSTVVSYLMGQHKRANLDFLTGKFL
jgi:hypothetical protein